MCYIYNADIYCDGCGEQIKRAVAEDLAWNISSGGCITYPDGTTTDDVEGADEVADYLDGMDEREYDSDEYPKHGSDDEESDCPQHCGSGADCVNAIEGLGCGCLIGNSLTADGVEYVREAVREGGEVADLWRDEFDWIDFDDDAFCANCGVGGEDLLDDLCADCYKWAKRAAE